MKPARARRPRPAPPLARNLALVYALLIIYACLHPFSNWRDAGLPPFDFLVAPWPAYWSAMELALNVLGFVPLGFLGLAALPGHWPPGRRVLLVALAGTALSLCLETIQNFLPTRVASNVDLACNGLGALLGALLAARFAATLFDPRGRLLRWRHQHLRAGLTGDIGLALLGAWLLTQLAPDSPHFVAGNLRPLLDLPPPLPFEPQLFIRLEAALTALGVVAVGLYTRALLRGPVWWVLILTPLAGLAGRVLAGSLFFSPPQPMIWLTPGAGLGLAIGAGLLLLALWLPRPVRHGVGMAALLGATVLANLMPDNPYLAGPLPHARAANLLNFQGLSTMLAALWPFLALVYLGLPGARRRL